ncbi:MAG TPA: hypothetical protein ENI51_10180 [Candidatus Atribacteria bacterium]|nr:hypothetical protein [Candidatus Atribacteria bacterium]
MTIVLIFIFFNPSCKYRVHYDPVANQCSVSYTECIGNGCVAPLTFIKCGETKKVCNKNIKCSCSDSDNTDWIKAY